MSAQCCERVQSIGLSFPIYHQCERRGKVKRDGKWYCMQHDPVAVAARRKRREVEFNDTIKRQVLGAFAPALLELLVRSRMESDVKSWQRERDALLRKLGK